MTISIATSIGLLLRAEFNQAVATAASVLQVVPRGGEVGGEADESDKAGEVGMWMSHRAFTKQTVAATTQTRESNARSTGRATPVMSQALAMRSQKCRLVRQRLPMV